MYTRGSVAGDYAVEGWLGEGSTSVVYRVCHRKRGTIHAMKVLCVAQPVARDRLLLEGRLQSRIQHPNVVSVREVVLLDEGPALVMDYIPGPSLETWLTQNQPGPEDALRLFAGLVRAVATVHLRGAVHRDLKPSNFLLDGNPHQPVPRLTDFGLVKVLHGTMGRGLTQSGAFLGSPAYMAPEQARDPRRADVRSDLWSLGCILHELLLHRSAFVGADPLEVANKAARGELTPLEEPDRALPSEAIEVIRDLLRVEPAERIQSCDALWRRLDGDACWGPLHPPEQTFNDEMDLPSETRMSTTFMLEDPAILLQEPAPPPPPAGPAGSAAARWAFVGMLVVTVAGGVWWWS